MRLTRLGIPGILGVRHEETIEVPPGRHVAVVFYRAGAGNSTLRRRSPDVAQGSACPGAAIPPMLGDRHRTVAHCRRSKVQLRVRPPLYTSIYTKNPIVSFTFQLYNPFQS